ncbi:hypothetical protein [Nocardia heshunensis]
MDFPLSEIKTIFQLYVHPPVAVDYNWTVTGVKDAASDAGVQLARLSGLLSTLLAADSKWGKAIADANGEISRMAPASAYQAIQAAIQKIKQADPNSMSDQIATNPASFWAPDWPGITAATIIGRKTEVTRQIMEEAARQADNPGFLKWVETLKIKGVDVGFSRFGLFGSVIGTLPSIADDINESHMNPTEAVVSESGGAAAGIAAAGWTSSLFAVEGAAGGAEAGAIVGAEVGSVVGTVAGLAVGAAVGYLIPKLIQWAW